MNRLRTWAHRWWRPLLAEVVSTALLVMLGCGTQVPFAGKDSVRLTHPALGFGCVVMANVVAFGDISGAHMNPAVTLGSMLYGQLALPPAVGYVLAQLLGATAGFYGLKLASPPDKFEGIGVTLPADGVSPLAAMATEIAITGMLVLTVCGIWDAVEYDGSAPIKIGLVVTGLIYSAGPATGASLNPARSFGPALVQGVWKHHWVYWAGPMAGGALAVFLQKWVMRRPRID